MPPRRHELTVLQLRSERRSENDRLEKLKASLQAKLELSRERRLPAGIRAA
jgi:hypothetical protein